MRKSITLSLMKKKNNKSLEIKSQIRSPLKMVSLWKVTHHSWLSLINNCSKVFKD